MVVLEKGERADPLWGIQTEYIKDEEIEALKNGKRLYLSVNNEYAIVIRYAKQRRKKKND